MRTTPPKDLPATLGALRASGLWRTPRGFNNVTVLRGAIAGGVLTGTATDLRCVTELNLRRVPPG